MHIFYNGKFKGIHFPDINCPIQLSCCTVSDRGNDHDLHKKNFSSTGNARSHTTNTLSVAVAILLYHPCNHHISVDIIGRQCKRGQCDAAVDQVRESGSV